jgi:sugar O-acyltransferase (sialic acid O-acetyltransferase NeuD family)
MSSGFVLFGVDSVFSAEVAETLRRLGVPAIAAIMTGDAEWDLSGMPRLLEESKIDRQLLSAPVVVPWTTPARRLDRTQRAKAAGFSRFEPVLDPSSVVAASASIAEGVYLNAGAVVGAHAVLSRSAMLNRNASIGHHTVLEEFVSIGPGATVAARCRIGPGAMIGTGASVGPGLRIGSNSVVGLGAAVIRDVPDNTLVAGNPAKAIRAVAAAGG